MEDRDAAPFGDDVEPAIRRIDSVSAAAETLDASELTGPMRTLEPSIQVVWILRASISAFLLGGLATIGSVVAFDDATFGGVIFVLAFVFGVVHAVLRYRIWRFQVREGSLYLERGVVRRVRTVVPYVRIQHVDVSRGPIERLFGLATTVVYTAGSRGADVSIPGLTPESANDLQDRLKQLAIAAEGDDAV